MKVELLLLTLPAMLCGCTASKEDLSNPGPIAGAYCSRDPAAYSPQAAQPSPRPVVYFSGQFNRTGRFDWTNGMTLKDGIDLAGGFTQWADRQLRLIHRDGSQDVYRLGPGKVLTNNPPLQPEDLVIGRGHVDAF